MVPKAELLIGHIGPRSFSLVRLVPESEVLIGWENPRKVIINMRQNLWQTASCSVITGQILRNLSILVDILRSTLFFSIKFCINMMQHEIKGCNETVTVCNLCPRTCPFLSKTWISEVQGPLTESALLPLSFRSHLPSWVPPSLPFLLFPSNSIPNRILSLPNMPN